MLVNKRVDALVYVFVRTSGTEVVCETASACHWWRLVFSPCHVVSASSAAAQPPLALVYATMCNQERDFHH